MTALAALTERAIIASLRELDLVLAVLVPVATFVGFNLALRNLIDTGGMSYAQYVLPAVILQTILIGALTTANRAALEQSTGFGVRMGTLPMSRAVPLMARMLYCLLRGIVAIAAAIGIAYVFGFQMTGGFGYAAAFVVVALALTLALSLGADALGTRIKKLDVAGQVLLVPQLLLVLLSTAMAPAESFPSWIRHFVRYQPVSQVAETLRGFTSGNVVAGNLALSLTWCLGLIVAFGAIALRMQTRIE